MRGKLFVFDNVGKNVGITPADAGKTSIRALRNSRLRDHPRGCGENQKLPKQQVMLSGSPPRMRGKLFLNFCRNLDSGITPADAGKTKSRTILSAVAEDHPRGCGENTESMEEIAVSLGSPPRMRGKQWADAVNGAAERITPADAGKTKKIL